MRTGGRASLVFSAVCSFAGAGTAQPAPPPAATARPAAAAESSRTDGFDAELYGFVELDVIHDTTGSYVGGSNNVILQRPGTYAGDHARLQFTANNSQIGGVVRAPEYEGMHVSAGFEVDFFGLQPTDVTEQNVYTAGGVRLRHLFLKLDTPIVDFLAGQYHDLFGWVGAGFDPNTVAFLGVPGQVYHRNPQLRVTRKFSGGGTELEVAVAAVRPAQRDSQLPDGQAGLRFALDGWTGAGAQGFGRPNIAPLAVGVSGVARRFAVTEFRTNPGNPNTKNGWGFAADVFLPIIPATAENKNFALSVTGQYSVGTGIADLYTALTGGARFPTLTNPGDIVPPPVYVPNVDVGLVTYDADANLQTIDWTSLLVGVQYYLPIDSGRVWVSGVYSRLESKNLATLTPRLDHGGIFTELEYIDAGAYFAVTPFSHIGVSFQTTRQTYGDGVKNHNNRVHAGWRLFF